MIDVRIASVITVLIVFASWGVFWFLVNRMKEKLTLEITRARNYDPSICIPLDKPSHTIFRWCGQEEKIAQTHRAIPHSKAIIMLYQHFNLKFKANEPQLDTLVKGEKNVG